MSPPRAWPQASTKHSTTSRRCRRTIPPFSSTSARTCKRPANDCWVVAPSNGFPASARAPQNLRPQLWRRSNPPQATLLRRLIRGRQWRAVPAPSARQLRDAPLRAHLAGARSNSTRWPNAQTLGRRFHRPRPQPCQPRRAVRVHRQAAHARTRPQPALDHPARHGRRTFRHLFALCRRHPALRPPLRRVLADHSERTRIRRQDHHVHPAGFRPRSPTSIPAATASSITAPATRRRAPRG